jgi:hypothetical protein
VQLRARYGGGPQDHRWQASKGEKNRLNANNDSVAKAASNSGAIQCVRVTL